MVEDAIIRWTARLAVACYAGRLFCDASGKGHVTAQQTGRWFWTIGCVLYLLHVIAAFHFLHGWSHAAAFEHVRRRTLHDIGWDSGIGIYINEGFTILWVIDTCLWWRRLEWPERRLPYWIVQTSFAFLMFQSTAVFGPRFWIPIASVLVLSLAVIHLRQTSVPVPRPPQSV